MNDLTVISCIVNIVQLLIMFYLLNKASKMKFDNRRAAEKIKEIRSLTKDDKRR